jgi:hypothetical protein
MKSPFLLRLRNVALCAGATILLAAPSKALEVSLLPVSSTIGVGGTVTIDMVISGLAAPGSYSLGAWMTEITYNSAIVSIGNTDVTLGTGIGSIDSQGFDVSTSGLVFAFQVSSDLAATLNANQAASFTLGSFTFTGVAPGTTSLQFSFLQLSDETGLVPLEVVHGFSANGARITVTGAGGVSDGGSTLGLLGLGLSVVLAARQLRVRSVRSSRS